MTLRSDKGFALAELLVTLVVLGMIGALIVTGVGTGRRVWQHLDVASAAAESVDNAQTALRNRLERAFPATRYDASAPYSDFAGATATMSFLAPDSDAHRPGALRRYALTLAVNGDLVLSSTSDLAAGDPPPHDDLILIHGVQGIDLAYFGVAPPDNVPRWRFNWEKRPTPPELVRVRVQFAQGDRRWWPDLIVHPYATVDSVCTLEMSNHRCRGRAS
jgi:general secretion pathway protein J